MNLAGHDLDGVNLIGQTDLIRSKVKGALARLHSSEIDFCVNIRGLQLPHQALRASDTNLRGRYVF